MAINPRAVGQGPKSKEELDAQRQDILDTQGLSARESVAEPTNEELRERLIKALEEQQGQASETADVSPQGAQLELPVEQLGVDDGQPTVVPDDLSVTPEQPVQPVEQLVQPEQQPMDLSVDTRLEDREAQRVPSPQEAWNAGDDWEALEEGVGNATAERWRSYYPKFMETDVVQFPPRDFLGMPEGVNPNDPSWDEELEKINDKKLKSNLSDQQPLMARKDNTPLPLTLGNIFSSNKLLGIATLNNKFEKGKENISKDEMGKITYGEGANFQPLLIDPLYMPTIMAVVEQHLADVRQGEMNIDSDVDMETGEAVFDPEREVINTNKLGRDAFQALRRTKATFQRDNTDSYLEDYKQTTPEVFDAIGASLLSLYHETAPGMTKIIDGVQGDSRARYALEDKAYNDVISKEADNYRLPNFKRPVLFTKPETGQFEDESSIGIRTRTGPNPYKDPAKLKEAKINASQVPMVFNQRKSSLFIGLLESAIATDNFRIGQGFNFTHEIIDLGDSRSKKILNIHKRMASKIEKADIDINELEAEISMLRQQNQPTFVLDSKVGRLKAIRKKYVEKILGYVPQTNEGRQFLKDLTGENLQPNGSMLRPLVYSFANKALEVGNTYARAESRPFYNTYANQSGTTRLNTVQLESFQNNLHMRQIIGSPEMTKIVPLSGSPEDQMILRYFTNVFFESDSMIPEAGVRIALDNIRSKSDRYKQFVRVGNKLKTLAQDYDSAATLETLGKLEVTPKGIRGLDAISKPSLLQAIEADPDLKALFEYLGSQKDAHKHTLAQLDAMMLLADYDASLANNNKPFYTQSTFEMDGISNGLMSLEAMVGNRAAMFRGGVMRVQGEEKVLGVFSDIKDAEGFEGDMRDLLGKRLELTLSGALPGLMIDDNKFQKDFGFTQEDIPLIKDMLTQALHPDNKANFRKSPLLTFPYGQELQNLIGSVVETIIEDPVLKQQAEEFGGVMKAAKVLSEIRNKAVIDTLGGELVSFSKIVKDAVKASNVFGLPMESTNPLGGKITFGGFVNQYTDGKKNIEPARRVDPESGETVIRTLQNALKKAKDEGNQDRIDALTSRLEAEKGRGVSYKVVKREKVFTPLAPRRGMLGGSSIGAALPTTAISMDGAVVAQLYSGVNWNNINQATGNNPFVLPIYDAFLVDFKTAASVERIVNNQWFSNTTDGKMLEGFNESFQKNMREGIEVFRELSKTDSVIDESVHGDVFDYVLETLYRQPDVDTDGLKVYKTDPEKRTYRNLFALQQMLLATQRFTNISNRFERSIEEAVKNSRSLAREVRGQGSDLLQYNMEGIFVGDFTI